MILNEFFNLPQVFEKDMTENEQTLTIGQQMAQDGIVYDHTKEDQLIGIMGEYMERSGMTPKQIRYYLSYDEDFVPDQLSYLPKNGDDAETFVQSEYVPRGREEDPGDLEHDLEQQDYQRRQQRDSDAEKALNKKDQDVEEGIFGSRPSPVLPIVDKIAKVAGGLTPQNVEVGKQIIQANARDITRMLSPQAKAGVDVIEQGVDEGEDNIPQQRTDKIRERFGRSFARKYAKELAEKVFAEHPKLTSYNLVQRYAFAIAIQELGSRQRLNWLMYDTDFASDILDAYVKLRGLPPIKQGVAEDGPVTIGSRLPKSDIETFGLEPGRGYKINNPKDWKQGDRPRAVQQLIPTQDKKDHIRSRLGKHVDPVLPEAKDDYVPPKEANYGKKYQAMVLRVGEKARAQEKAKQQQQPKAPVRESRLALLKQIIQS